MLKRNSATFLNTYCTQHFSIGFAVSTSHDPRPSAVVYK